MTNGEQTVGEWLKDIPVSFASRAYGGVSPILRGGAELVLGYTAWPDVTDPRPIRDRGDYIAQSLRLEKVYRGVTGTPQRERGVRETLLGSFLREADPGEVAYNKAKRLEAEWQQKQGKPSDSSRPSAKSQALYNYKKALKYNQPDRAQAFLQDYRVAGGTMAGLQQSIRLSAPGGSIAEEDRLRFMMSLTVRERQVFQRGQRWWSEVRAGRSVPLAAPAPSPDLDALFAQMDAEP